MANRIDLSNILINFLKKARYERHIEEGTLEENQFYAVTDGNEKTEYGDLFGNIENQADLYNALYASRLFKMEMCNDVRGYDIVHKLYDRREFDLSKFTVVGNPTISEDGIVSGFSNNNYLKILDNFNPQGKWDIMLRVKEPTNSSDSYYLGNLDMTNKRNIVIGKDSWGRFKLWLSSNGTSWDIVSGMVIPGTFNEYVFLKVGFDETKYYIEKSLDGENWTNRSESLSSTKIYPSSLLLGIAFGSGYYTRGSIDLKYFSITVDGTEVFNGLKDFKRYDTYTLPSSEVITIPYIPSVDGVKIVDVAYKPLVDQLYAETGMGNYIIIDETNKTFRLPLPDIYSQIENKTSFTLRKWED